MQRVVDLIHKSENILLSTHRQCDGDGLGAELAVFYALKKIGKNVRIVNVDGTPRKYHFLDSEQHIAFFSENTTLPEKVDLFLVFDTNDERLVEPLFSAVLKMKPAMAFIDHHPVLKMGPAPSPESWIDTRAASTGEMSYMLIKGLQIPLDRQIARALYTSITFDTQLYRFIRNSPVSHQIAAELLTHDIAPEEIHRGLFGNQTVHKMAFLAKALGQIEYFAEGRLALLKIRDADLFHYNLEPDDSRDVVDMVMNIETLEAAVLFREDSPDEYKVSLRSKGHIEVLEVAEGLGGGGHPFSAGAQIHGDFQTLKLQVVEALAKKLRR